MSSDQQEADNMSLKYRNYLLSCAKSGEKPKTAREFTQRNIDPKEARTKQSFKSECDINHIINKFHKTGILEHQRQILPRFMDVSAVDYQEALNLTIEAGEMFEALPSQIRNMCDNDPAKFLQYIQDPKNKDELVKFGLLEPKKPAPAPQKVEIVNPPKEPDPVPEKK
jgi:phage internal scaffolding protein